MSAEVHVAWVAGFLALSGAALGYAANLVQSALERKHQQRTFLREKYEEMAGEFLQASGWLSEFLASQSLEQLQTIAHARNANRVHMLCLLYFPELAEASGKFLDACTTAYRSLGILYKPLAQGPLAAHVHGTEQYKAATGNWASARNELQQKIHEHGSSYARS